MNKLKICSKCKIEKELCVENFEAKSANKDGYINICKKCRNDRRREIYDDKYKSKNNRKWTDEECEILIKHYPFISGKEISEKYLAGRTVNQINDKATKGLKLCKDKSYSVNWSMEQLDYVEENYKNLDISISTMSKHIGKSEGSLKYKANHMGLFRAVEVEWTDEELKLLYKYYPFMTINKLISEHLINKTHGQIARYVSKIGLKKNMEFKTNIAIENLGKIKDQNRENSPKWVKRFDVECVYCGEIMQKRFSDIKNQQYIYCSTKCRGEWMSENRTGENNSNYGNGSTWTPEMRKKGAERAIKYLTSTDKSYSLTKPQKIMNELLDTMKINYTNEFDCKYYLLDNHLTDYNLGIEVHGNFFHCHPLMSSKNSRKTKIIGKDKAKHTYIKKYIGFEVLYLWELDIIKNINVCEKLIKKYIENNGVLDNYHSFNYSIVDDKLVLNDNIVDFHY